jgi:hypothetical protein
MNGSSTDTNQSSSGQNTGSQGGTNKGEAGAKGKPIASDYQSAAERAILTNKDLSSASRAAAIAVLETALNNALEVVSFLTNALAKARGGTGQDGGNATIENPFDKTRAG